MQRRSRRPRTPGGETPRTRRDGGHHARMAHVNGRTPPRPGSRTPEAVVRPRRPTRGPGSKPKGPRTRAPRRVAERASGTPRRRPGSGGQVRTGPSAAPRRRRPGAGDVPGGGKDGELRTRTCPGARNAPAEVSGAAGSPSPWGTARHGVGGRGGPPQFRRGRGRNCGGPPPSRRGRVRTGGVRERREPSGALGQRGVGRTAHPRDAARPDPHQSADPSPFRP